jgi:hypothetical protein
MKKIVHTKARMIKIYVTNILILTLMTFCFLVLFLDLGKKIIKLHKIIATNKTINKILKNNQKN